MRTMLIVTAVVGLAAGFAAAGEKVTLSTEHVLSIKGDGPDGKGNTNDDTWQFWFELVAPHDKFLHLDVCTQTMSPAERKNGRRRKITGPIAGLMPNKNDSEGWIYHSDWDGRMEGAWADKKIGKVILHPYVEKGAHRACALTYTVPKNGEYRIAGKVTDGQVWKHPQHKGFFAQVGTAGMNGKFMVVTKHLTKTPVIGDEVGPASAEFKVGRVSLKKGQMVFVMVNPNGWWGSDVMVIDLLEIERLDGSGDAGKESTAKPAPAESPKETPPAEAAKPIVKVGNELTYEIAANPHGDGPDGTGNTGDDTWQFWFQVIHNRNLYVRLDLATKLLSEDIRKNGIRRKVWGPIASTTPNPQETEGWIYHSDWDGKREGVWGDAKDKQVLVMPYQEKADGGALAVTYKVPADGKYKVSGSVTDLEVREGNMATGIRVSVDVTTRRDGKSIGGGLKMLVPAKPCGDKAGPKTVSFASPVVELQKDQLVRLIIDPNGWAVGDTTRVDAFRAVPVKE